MGTALKPVRKLYRIKRLVLKKEAQPHLSFQNDKLAF